MTIDLNIHYKRLMWATILGVINLIALILVCIYGTEFWHYCVGMALCILEFALIRFGEKSNEIIKSAYSN